jgi:hypothetical protein
MQFIVLKKKLCKFSTNAMISLKKKSSSSSFMNCQIISLHRFDTIIIRQLLHTKVCYHNHDRAERTKKDNNRFLPTYATYLPSVFEGKHPKL